MTDTAYHPIIYVRGYAATQGAIEETVATPYMGFNIGSTKYRQTYTGEVQPYVFESPLIRLIKDHEYVDAYHDGEFIPSGPVNPRSIWIFRYYDITSKELQNEQVKRRKDQEIEDYAKKLQIFILHIREAVNMKKDKNFRLYLIAHSMGGLICRCYLQNSDIPDLDGKKGTNDWRKKGVDKFFTYATPHGGIDFRKGLGWVEGLRDFMDVNNSANFGPKRMSEFLKTKPNNLKSLNGKFPPERVFCLIGTDPSDYGLSRKAVGPQSDGLVQIQNAYVKGSSRAYVYRSHSGHYGIVNSESGYRNLERFLFGDARASVALDKLQIDLPNNDPGFTATYNIENIVSIRGIPTPLNKRTKDTYSSTFRKHDDIQNQKIHLFTTFLWKGGRVRRRSPFLGFSIHFRIVPEYHQNKRLWWDHHYEGQAVFDDRLIIVTKKQTDNTFKALWNWGSQSLDATRPLQLKHVGKKYVVRIPFTRARPLKVSGEILIEITSWNI